MKLLKVSMIAVLAAATAGLPMTGNTQAQSTQNYLFTPDQTDNYTTSGPIIFDGDHAQVEWYDTAWKYRQKITIHKEWIGEELTDFPVLIRLNDTNVYNHARPDSNDLVFTTSDGTTKLSHEVESKEAIWVKVPSLSPTKDTDIYLYYGNADVGESQENATDVWTNGFVGVWHMDDDPAASTEDATANSNDGTGNGGMNRADSLTTGKIGQALSFDGSDDYVEVGDSESLDRITTVDALTVCGWAKPDVLTRDLAIATRWVGALDAHFILWMDTGGVGDGWAFALKLDGVTTKVGEDNTDAEIGVWQMVCGSWDGSAMRVYKNGAQSEVQSSMGSLVESDTTVKIGDQDGFKAMDGLIDEVRISSTARSASWIKAEYANQSEVEDFLTINNTVESRDKTISVTLNADQSLAFDSLSSFTANGSGNITWQLSNDACKTWQFYTAEGWKGANPDNPNHRSSSNDIAGHITSFPKGQGQLTWRAYLEESSATLDGVTVVYTTGTKAMTGLPATVKNGSYVPYINQLHRTAFGRNPTFEEWTYWAKRMINGEKDSLAGYLGAMEWQRMVGF